MDLESFSYDSVKMSSLDIAGLVVWTSNTLKVKHTDSLEFRKVL